jgi:MoaA/NifB/PqqE/SkfB family radical SAM enzyme
MSSERTPLETVIPLSTPFSIYIDPSSACNFQCGFCPTADRELMKSIRKVGFIEFDLYRKIIDDLREFDKPLKALRLYIDGEPLLNPRFADMVRLAKRSGCVYRVDTTTNASRLTPELSSRIIDAGIDQINVSIYGMNAEQYQDFTKYRIDFDKLVGGVRYLYEHRGNCKIIVKINGDVISKEDETKFLEVFEPIATGVNVEHVMSCWPEFNLGQNGLQANQLFGIYGQPIKEVSVCPYVFFSLAIHPDGTVSTCFLDWSRKLTVGDTKIQSVKDIWNGAKLREHQMIMLRGERKSHPVCGNCGQMSHGMPDDVDAHASVLLHKIEAIR